MSNILSEISRVREIMGLINEQSNEEINVSLVKAVVEEIRSLNMKSIKVQIEVKLPKI